MHVRRYEYFHAPIDSFPCQKTVSVDKITRVKLFMTPYPADIAIRVSVRDTLNVQTGHLLFIYFNFLIHDIVLK